MRWRAMRLAGAVSLVVLLLAACTSSARPIPPPAVPTSAARAPAAIASTVPVTAPAYRPVPLNIVVPVRVGTLGSKDARDYEQLRPAAIDPDGKLGLDSLRDELARSDSAGLVKDRVDMSQLVDTRFTEYAVRQLGPYQRCAWMSV
jgi:hypothetical protein